VIAVSRFGNDILHGKDRTGLLGAMAAHALSNRTRGMTRADVDFAPDALKDPETMKYFGYTLPTAGGRRQNGNSDDTRMTR
jgi:hypothetical protein